MGISHRRRLGDRRIRMIGLDLAGRSGYAIQFGDDRIKVGTMRLDRGSDCKGKRNPLPMIRLYRRLQLLSKYYEIGCVVFEETFGRGAAKFRLDSMQNAVILWAINEGVNWARISPPQWKLAMTGKGTATKQEYTEAAILKFPEHTFHYDDEAAARWLLEYGITRGGF